MPNVIIGGSLYKRLFLLGLTVVLYDSQLSALRISDTLTPVYILVRSSYVYGDAFFVFIICFSTSVTLIVWRAD